MFLNFVFETTLHSSFKIFNHSSILRNWIFGTGCFHLGVESQLSKKKYIRDTQELSPFFFKYKSYGTCFSMGRNRIKVIWNIFKINILLFGLRSRSVIHIDFLSPSKIGVPFIFARKTLYAAFVYWLKKDLSMNK